MHHNDIHQLVFGICEFSVRNIIFLVDISPFCIKADGVYKIHYRFVGDVVKYFVYHTVGIVAYPIVNLFARCIVKCTLVYRRTEIIRIFLQKVLFNGKPVFFISEPYRICVFQLEVLA